jgi:hypothetical protein
MKDANDHLRDDGADGLRDRWDKAERRTGHRFPIHTLDELAPPVWLFPGWPAVDVL